MTMRMICGGMMLMALAMTGCGQPRAESEPWGKMPSPPAMWDVNGQLQAAPTTQPSTMPDGAVRYASPKMD